jgi:hypothetical protein
MRKTKIFGLQERQDTPQVLTSSEESLNSPSLTNTQSSGNSMSNYPLGCGCNNREVGSISAKHNVFVLDVNEKPLTPTTNAKARKLMRGKQAVPIWNKFGQFGIRMLVDTGKVIPKTALGVDFGTKFEGYTVTVGQENNLAVMWLLPDKKKLVKKIEERSQLRRARRWRQCGRRAERFDNRERQGFIAPAQMLIINSRLKSINEFFKCYPINTVAMEDVCFNHRDNRWGKNFSTIEVGKRFINNHIRQKANLTFYKGYDTEVCREWYGYVKSHNKSAQVFNSHCSDALAIATDVFAQTHIAQGKLIIVDDTYRPVRRKLHDTQPAKGGVRDKYSRGNFKGIRKGTICDFGQVCGGIKDKIIRTYDWNNNRQSKSLNKVSWLSHRFKILDGGQAIPLHNKLCSTLA